MQNPPMESAVAILERLDRAADELHAATKAALAIAKTSAAETERKAGDDREWTRFPKRQGRCRVSEWSARQIDRLSQNNKVETKHVGKARYYSLADVRKLIESK